MCGGHGKLLTLHTIWFICSTLHSLATEQREVRLIESLEALNMYMYKHNALFSCLLCSKLHLFILN